MLLQEVGVFADRVEVFDILVKVFDDIVEVFDTGAGALEGLLWRRRRSGDIIFSFTRVIATCGIVKYNH